MTKAGGACANTVPKAGATCGVHGSLQVAHDPLPVQDYCRCEEPRWIADYELRYCIHCGKAEAA